MPKKLIHGRSSFTKRRLTIIFILCTIIAVSLMTGFSGLNSDNTKHSAVGQRICMYEDPPTDGTTPEDHDLISNVKYTAQQLYMSRYFRGETVGKVEAELGAGLSYTQNVYNTRVVKGDKIFTESISSSWAKSVGEQKYIDGTRVLYRPSTSVSGSTAKFSNSVKNITKDYGKMYGLIPNELTKQVLSVSVDPEKPYGVTIKSVRDDNAKSSKTAAQLNAANDDSDDTPVTSKPEEVINFNVPQSLVPDKNGNFKFTLFLEPVSATLYSRNETRTLAGSSQNPDYSSESDGSVTVTIVIDKNWYPISVNVRETYGIEIPGIGALICNSNLTETFSEIGNKDIVLPEQEFFESHMSSIGGGDVPPTEPEAADYLMYAFGKYISGAENLDLTANVSIGDIDVKNLKVSLNIGTMNVRARYDDLYIEYDKGTAVGRPNEDLVYITLNDIKGYLPLEKATGLIDDPAVGTLIKMFASGIALPDFGSLLGDDLMAGMTCEKTNKYIYINIPIELEDIGSVNATMTLKNNENYDLVSITGTVEALGKTITLSVKPAKNLVFETPDKTYADLSPVVDFVPSAISTVLDNDTYGIRGEITVDGKTVALDAYIERDQFKTVAADATVTLLGQNVSIKYTENTLYVSIGNVGVKAEANDIPTLIEELKPYLGTDTGMLDKLKALLPQTIGDWISTLKSLTADEHSVNLGLRILGAPISVSLSRDGNLLTGVSLDAKINIPGVKLAAAAALDIAIPERREIAPNAIEYIDSKELPGLIPFILDYVNAAALDADVHGKITVGGTDVIIDGRVGIDLSNGATVNAVGKITALDQTLDVAYIDDVAYIGLGNLRMKLAAADVEAFIPHIENLLAALGVELTMTDIGNGGAEIASLIPTVLGAVKSATVKDNALALQAEILGATVSLTVNAETGAIQINGDIQNVKLDLNCRIGTCLPEELDFSVENANAYDNANEFIPTIEALAEFIRAKSASAKFSASYNGITVGGSLAVDLNNGLDGLKLRLEITELTGENIPNVTAALTLIGKTAYIEIRGNINVALAASTDDVSALLESLGTVIPSELLAVIENALNIAGDLDGTIGDALKNAEAPNIDDIRRALDSVLSAITMSVANGNVNATVSLLPIANKDITLSVNATTDLSSVRADATLGTAELTARLYNMTSGATIEIPDGEFISIKEFKPIIDAVLPVINAEGYKFDIDAVVFGVKVSGKLTISRPTDEQALAVEAAVVIGDVPITLIYKNDSVYLDVNNGEIMLSCGTTKAELEALIEKVVEAVPELKGKLDGLASATSNRFSIENLLNIKISLDRTADGFATTVDLSPVGLDAVITIGFGFDDGLSGLTVDVAAHTSDEDKSNDIVIDIDLIVELDENGVLRALRTTEGAEYAVSIEIADLSKQTVNIGSADGYIALTALTDFIAPVINLLDNINSVKSLSFGINAYVLTEDMQRLSISGKVELDLDTVAIRINLNLLNEKIYITYVGNVLYIKLGGMQLKFTISDDKESSDIARIYAILDEYLPRYLSEELAVLFGLTEGETSSLSDVGLIIDRFTAMSSAKTLTDKAALLFGKLHDYDGAPSAIKKLADMVNLYMLNGTPTIGFAATDDIVIDITPFLTSDKSELSEISVDTEVSGMTVHASIGAPTLSDTALGIAAPEHSDKYVSLIDYVELINNIVHTFTTKNADGDITFAINKFDFTYKQNDSTVKNADGTESVVAGKTITVESVSDGNGGSLPILKGKLVKTKNNTYDINLEAHLKLSGISENAGDVTLALYVLTNYLYKANENDDGVLYDKVAFLSYKESKTGYGENVSIDYGSVMQILASVFKILGVNDTTVNKIIPAEYRVDIDSSVFKSMDIVGMDGVRETIDSLVSLLINVENAAKDVKKAWELVKAPDSMEFVPDADGTEEKVATREDKINALLGSMDDIKAHIKSAIGRFASKDAEPTEKPTEITEIKVPEFSDIANGITLTSVNGDLGATVKNSLTTGGDGVAQLLVSQGVNAAGKCILNGISIENLDVNTALIENIDIDFTSGGDVTIAPDMSALINVTDDKNKTTYSDFSNIKHLLFDVLNTANLMEFDIGGIDTSDTIHLNMNIIGIDAVDFDIHYNVKVKLFDKAKRLELGLITADQAKDPDEPDYKAAAYVELYYKDCTALSASVVGDLTTRLYFYDNVLYVDGVKSWAEKKLSYGGFLGIGATTKTFYECERVYAQYTIDEFFYMVSNDIEKFLYEFLFYLMPLSTNFTIFKVNLQSSIADAVKPKEGEQTEQATPTIATVFKGYTYNEATHGITIGLSELAGNKSLSDLKVTLTGANNHNDDVNLLDNYVSGLTVNTSFASMVNLSLNASLRNADTTDPYHMVSTGLGGAKVYDDHWYLGNKQFIFDGKDVAYASLPDLLKGELPITGGTANPWTEIWKEAYEAAAAA